MSIADQPVQETPAPDQPPPVQRPAAAYLSFYDIDSLIVEDERQERDDDALLALMESLQICGMIQPIVLVLEADGRFRVVCGRRRVLAARNLGWASVPGILWQLDDVHRKLATISENLHRLELTSAERDAQMLEYCQLYASIYPDAERAALRRSLANLVKDEEERQAILDAPVVDTPVQAASKAFGVSPGTTKKAVRRARAFTSAQRKILDMCDIPDRQLDLLAAEDADVIESVVKLIAADYAFDDAMRQVLEESGRDYAKPPAQPRSTDDYLKTLASRRLILDTSAFDSDVQLYLDLNAKIEAFKKEISWDRIEAENARGPHGLYLRRLRLAFNAPPPPRWSACGCQLQQDPEVDPSSCPTCRGGGYQIGG